MERSCDEDTQMGGNSWEASEQGGSSASSPTLVTSGIPQERSKVSTLAEVFGYYGSCSFNTMALVRKVSCPQPCDKALAITMHGSITRHGQ